MPKTRELSTKLARLVPAVVLMGAASTVFRALLPDFLHNELGISGDVRGSLEFPRELPGFLMVLVLGMMAGFRKSRAMSLASLAAAAGLAGIAFLVRSLPGFVVFMVLLSTGQHMFFPLRDAMAMELSDGKRRGTVLGIVGASRSIGLVSGTAFVWLCMEILSGGYSFTYATAGLLCLTSAVVSLFLPTVKGDFGRGGRRPALRERFLYRKRYRIYYALCVLFGARKQIFLTFAPWLLVSLYDQRAPQLALAMGVAAVLGMGVKPMLGKMIDMLGERTILTADSVFLILLCAGYAIVPYAVKGTLAVLLLYGFYVLDELLFSLSMARTTYLSQIVLQRREMVPTMGLGVTLDHLVSMLVPPAAGLLWVSAGSWAVFTAAGGVALITLVTVQFMSKKEALERGSRY